MKLKRLKIKVLLGLSLLLLFACKKSKSFKSTGKQVEVTRQLGSFNNIALYNNVNLYLIQDSINSVTLSGGENLLPFVTTKINNHQLQIRNENKMNWLRSYKKSINAYVHFKNVDQLFYYGSGNITGKDTIREDKFSVTCWDGSGSIKINFAGDSVFNYIHTGPADIHVKGRAAGAYIYCHGTGFIYIDSLSCKDVFINNSGTGDMYVKPKDNIGLEIYSIGNVFCESHPSILWNTDKGKGKLIFE